MSNTFKTNKARTVRKLNKKSLGEFNDGDRSKARLIFQEMKEMETNGVRYGNHRKMRAMEKVKERRIERKKRNAESAEAMIEAEKIIRFNF